MLIRADLRKVTLRELTDFLKAINDNLRGHSKMTVAGKKEEVVNRLGTFIISLLMNDNKSSIQTVVNIANATFGKKLCWNFVNGVLVTNSKSSNKSTKPPKPAQSLPTDISFKTNPFFAPMIKLTPYQLVPVTNDRSSKYIHFGLSDEHRKLLATTSTDGQSIHQIRFYCCKANAVDSTEALVDFPNVCEIRINGNVIGGNALRGLKNKPGTVNPPDLTVLMRKGGLNSIEFVYCNTDVAYLCALYMVQRTPISALINSMTEKQISKEAVIERLQEKQQEDEVVLESETLSTKCPLAFTRIVTPIRSVHCNHLQCFDANTFLVMNEQTPTWSCPVCYKIVPDWNDFVVDGYFAEILKNTPEHIENVKVEPDGNIIVIDVPLSDGEEQASDGEGQEIKEAVVHLLDDDDDDNNENIPNLNSNEQEPFLKKRRLDVIDLTLSDDD
ncbi:hypothetical protein G6F56_007216 [Rhizopus delemar]|uniref:SUMO ligase siz1 n=1 Tax=Rhizopus stolonifer TaxID=4846 RepID=A0A367IWE2_RHIST|nr:hypothetical protein G6F56_007216 [Rhizopus delemar]RCH81997.1 SUMO ligase siz1 [Rhizopus stolonifer]